MGSNRRYGSDVTDAALNEMLVRPRPISLSEGERGAAEVREASEPVPVKAWVRFPEMPVLVDGRAVAWTDRAVWVEFTMRDGSTMRAWVWASAVRRS
ncbi:hypothetical protein N1031_07095 [Herbiconiux moechotypicola]|uniref:Uncharacterized protein n=1 Tax=Herbiconiux moechotypicola TaxID=637393 RepID=A0ABP5QE22_9MICO|nr:hypothetical protein [Herbiconiux moechotypicola]MCS5729523.1 hypothetical protein [Herbiconiux moechotypicola]